MEEFILALGSDRIIEFASGTYDLSDVKDRYLEHVYWEPVFDGLSLTVRGVDNLTIRGAGVASTKLLVRPRYAYVLGFDKCRNVSLVDLTLGHTPSGYCTGGVVCVAHSQDIRIDRCSLFGCGTEGLTLQGVDGFTIANSEVFDCTYGIASITSCKNVLFETSTFKNNREFHGFSIRDSDGVYFKGCNVYGNECRNDLFDVASSSAVHFSGGEIKNNRCTGLGSVSVENAKLQEFSES